MNLIIGGTHGLGWEMAQRLQQQGEDVFVTGRSYNAAKHGAGKPLDLSNEEAVKAFANNVAGMELTGF